MHPADITAALKKRGSSGAAVARRLGITRQCVHLIVSGAQRSRRVEREISRVTHLSLKTLWPQYYAPEADAPARKVA